MLSARGLVIALTIIFPNRCHATLLLKVSFSYFLVIALTMMFPNCCHTTWLLKVCLECENCYATSA